MASSTLRRRPWESGDTPFGRATYYARIQDGTCPPPVKIGRMSAWLDRERFLDAWSRYKVGPPPEEASNRQAPNKGGAGVADALTAHAGHRGKAADPIPQERELPVQRMMMSADTHDERVQFESGWIRRSKEKREKR